MRLWLMLLLASVFVFGDAAVYAEDHGGDEDHQEEEARPGKERRGKKGKRGRRGGPRGRRGKGGKMADAPKEVKEFRKGQKERMMAFREGMKKDREALADSLEGLDGEKCRAARKEGLQALKAKREAHRKEMEGARAEFIKGNPDSAEFFEQPAAKGKKGKMVRRKAKMKKGRKAMRKLKCKGDQEARGRKGGKRGMKGKGKGTGRRGADDDEELEDPEEDYEDDE